MTRDEFWDAVRRGAIHADKQTIIEQLRHELATIDQDRDDVIHPEQHQETL